MALALCRCVPDACGASAPGVRHLLLRAFRRDGRAYQVRAWRRVHADATVGLIRFALGDAFTLTWQLAAFSAFTILYLAVLRRVLTKIFSGSVERSSIDLDKSAVGRTGQVTAEIAPPKTGRVMIGDAEWTAIASAPIAAGVDVKVVGQDNLTMTVEPL